jgi:large subunit ribosomal protein L21
MYAVIKTGGKQYRVQAGDLLVVEKLAGEPGEAVTFGDILMVGDGDSVTVGAPVVEGASVAATLIETRKGDKIKIFKKIRRQGYRRTGGHRQLESVLRVTSVEAGGKSVAWDGTVDLTTRAVLNARARGFRDTTETSVAVDEAATDVVDTTVVAEEAVKPARKPRAKKAAASETGTEA